MDTLKADHGDGLLARRVAVVIPAFQEERLLPVTLASLPQWIDELIVVDDASTDRTREVALEYARRVHARDDGPRVRVLTLPTNQGVGRAISVGYLEAWGAGADVAVVMGADAQMNPLELPALLAALTLEVAYVKGDRMRHPEVRQRMPTARYWGNRILSLLTGLLMGSLKLSDAQCGYTALDLNWLPQLELARLYPRYGFPNDLLLRLNEAGGHVRQVSVTPIYGDERSKLSIPRVILPLLGVLTRGWTRGWLSRYVQGWIRPLPHRGQVETATLYERSLISISSQDSQAE